MKPYVICHMVASVDGRILIGRWRPEDPERRRHFEPLHDRLGVEGGPNLGHSAATGSRLPSTDSPKAKRF